MERYGIYCIESLDKGCRYVLILAVACVSLLAIHFYRYTKMTYHKSWFYWFYPLHLLLICVIRQMLLSFA